MDRQLRKKLTYYGACCCLLLGISCSQTPSPIIGNWVAADVRQQGDTMRLDPQQVRFDFQPDGRYHYQSTLRYREAGTYRVEGNFLLARDTTNLGSVQRVVRIELLKPDSLVLRMKEGELERRVVFLRP